MSVFLLVFGVFCILYSFFAVISIWICILAAFICALFFYCIVVLPAEKILTLAISSIQKAFFIAFLLVLYELFRTYILGLPWGNASDLILLFPFLWGIAHFWGRYGLSLFILFLPLCVFLCERKLAIRILMISLFFVIGLNLIGVGQESLQKNISIALIESGFDKQEKLSDTFFRAVGLFKELSESIPEVDLLILPETALNIPSDRGFLAQICAGFLSKARYVLTGAIALEKGRFYNAAVLCDRDANLFFYYKRRLVPFGEFMPFRRFIPKGLLKFFGAIEAADFSKGNESILFDVRNIKVMPLICYEDSFVNLIIPLYKDADIMVILTSDIWFGEPFARKMHTASNKLLAIESGRTVIRCSTQGPSAVFLPNGEGLYSNAFKVVNSARIFIVDAPVFVKSTSFYYTYGIKIIILIFILCGIILIRIFVKGLLVN